MLVSPRSPQREFCLREDILNTGPEASRILWRISSRSLLRAFNA